MATSKIQKPSKTATTVTGSYIQNSWPIYKRGNTVYLNVINFDSIPAGAFSMSGVIPEGYRPSQNVSYTLVRRNAQFLVMAMAVSTDGTLSFYNYGNAQSSGNTFNHLVNWDID